MSAPGGPPSGADPAAGGAEALASTVERGRAAGGHAARGFLALGAGELLARVVAFGASVYVSRTLGAARFGIVGFAMAVLLYLQRFVSWELEAAGVTEAMERTADARHVIAGLFAFRFAVAGIVVALVASVGRALLPELDAAVLLRYALALFAVALNARWVYLMRREPRRPALARVVSEAVGALVVVALVQGPDDVAAVPLGLILGEAAGAALLLAPLVREGALAEPWRAGRAVRTIIERAFPLLLSGILGLIVFNLDLVMLRLTRGPSEAGYYAAAYAIVSLLVNLGMAYYANVLPAFMRLRGDGGATQALYEASLALVLIAALPIAVGGALVAGPMIALVYGSGYAASSAPLALLMASVALNVLRFVPLAALVASGRPRQVLMVSACGAALNVSLNLWLIPRLGMLGAAASTVCTDVVRLALNLWFVRGSGVRVGRTRALWRPLGASVLMGAAVWAVQDRPVWLSVPLGAVVYGLALVLLGALRVERGGRIVVRA